MIYVVLIVLLVFSAFFSSLETGLLALGEVRISKWSENKIKPLKIWIKEPAGVITGILIGNNFVNIVFSSIFTVLLADHVRRTGSSVSWIEIVSIICSSAIILVFGEIVPKIFAITHPDRVVAALYGPFVKFYSVSKVLIRLLNNISFSLTRVMKSKKEKNVSRKEVQVALGELVSEGMLERDSSRMLERVLFLSKKTAGEVMVSRDDIFSVDLEWDYSRIVKKLIESPYSRIPAYSEDIDELKGIIYLKDVIGALVRNHRVDFREIMRQPHVTYPGRNCHHLFHKMRSSRMHCSVVKSRGRVMGIITIEDIIEEVVGEIYDEYDNRIDTV
ncbi:MAG: CNNM domain-containing protein [Elusimicrobiota bacterium]